MSKMSSKDKEKTLHDRLKQFFRLNKGGTGNIKGRVDFSLTREIEVEIGRESPVHHRIKVIRELSEAVLQNHLEEHAIEKLWILVQDLLLEEVAREHRHAVFQFLCSLAQGQAEKLGLMRAQFFRLISTHTLSEDIGPRLELLSALTANGKDILYIEEQVAPFLLGWMPAVHGANKTNDLLSLLVNLIKFNSAYVEDSVISGLIQNACFLCSWSQQEEVVLSSLALLEVIVCYAQVPPNMLDTFISTLCIAVNNKNYCESCWKIMRKLLGTHVGHGALLHMCRLMQDSVYSSKASLLRGAVFHVGMGMWGAQRVTSLNTTATGVLPSFLEVLKTDHIIVTYEVVLCIQRLVCQSPEHLSDPAWDSVLGILEEAVAQVSRQVHVHQDLTKCLQDALSAVETLYERGEFRGEVKRFFCIIDSYAAARPESSVLRLISHLAGDLTPTKHEWLTKLQRLVERYFWQETRTNIRVKVLCVLSSVIHTNRALYEEELVERVLNMLDPAVAKDPDLAVRNAAVQLLVDLTLDCDNKRCIELLDLIEKFMHRPFEAYDVDEKNIISGEADAIDVKSAVLGMIKIFRTKAFQLPSTQAMRAYRALVNSLESHYKHPAVFEHCSVIRFLIFKCFLQIRADSLYHLGMPEHFSFDDDVIHHDINNPRVLQFSPYIVVDHKHGEKPTSSNITQVPSSVPAASTTPVVRSGASSNTTSTPVVSPAPTPATSQSSPPVVTSGSPTPVPAATTPAATSSPPVSTFPPPVVTHLSLTHACKAVITCLKEEKEWRVLQLVLRELPQVMQNKALVLSRHGNDVEYLASALCAMVSEKKLNLPESLKNTPPKLSRSDFQSLVLMSLASLASYPLEPGLQLRLVKCLQTGLASRCAGACVSALTLCTLEMRDTMYKLLPEVLLNLSKISATVHVAIPILEFLSTLTRLPKVFARFVGDQYMAVFAISLPYTNPFKYNHYTVSLAHHVIAVWFLKCQLPFRRDFVKFIITGLKANVLVPFEEGQMKKPELVNEDSSNRKRSSSLTEQGSRRREQLSSQRLEMKPAVDEELLTFHTELTETCIDLMARHTFSSCSAIPHRLSTAEWLLNGGQSMTWLLGHKLVTVTTSGCSQKAMRGGLCEKCLQTCRLSAEKAVTAPPPTTTVPTSPVVEQPPSSVAATIAAAAPVNEGELTPSRRRHKSAVQRSVSGDVPTLTPRTKDDLHMTPAPRILDGEQGRSDSGPFGQERSTDGSERALCSCWCQNWAEIHIRRPTGNMSWVMRLQNPMYFHSSSPLGADFPLGDISTLFLPALSTNEDTPNNTRHASATASPDVEGIAEPQFEAATNLPPTTPTSPMTTTSPSVLGGLSTARPLSDAVPVPGSNVADDDDDDDNDDYSDCDSGEGRQRNPVRRSNSSPEMSGRLKSPLAPPALYAMPLPAQSNLEQDVPPPSPGPMEDKRPAIKSQPTKVSCEAIPEEMGGTTPPSATPGSESKSELHAPPLLQSSVSYPGPDPPKAVVTSTVAGQTSSQPQSGTASMAIKQTLVPTRSAPPPQQQQEKRTERSPPQESRPDPSTLPPLAFRDRGHTISVMSPVRKPDWGALRRNMGGNSSPRTKDPAPKYGISPSMVFLQLYHDGQLGGGGDRPLLVPQTENLRTLDYIPPYETHKLGVLYIGPGQAGNETAILQNEAGSMRYMEFLQGLGTLVRLRDVDPQTTFLGGIDVNNDGKFAYIWQDAMTQVIFHTATLMPTNEKDVSCNNKKRHIGNDYVTIVFNESGEDYNMQTIKGQFNFACVIVTPIGHGTNQVTVKAKEVLAKHLGALETKVISDHSLPTLVRQLALHANLASMIVKQTQAPYASNWLERLRNIKRIRARVCANAEAAPDSSRTAPSGLQKRAQMDDFTEYTHYK